MRSPSTLPSVTNCLQSATLRRVAKLPIQAGQQLLLSFHHHPKIMQESSSRSHISRFRIWENWCATLTRPKKENLVYIITSVTMRFEKKPLHSSCYWHKAYPLSLNALRVGHFVALSVPPPHPTHAPSATIIVFRYHLHHVSVKMYDTCHFTAPVG
jgi:hypothetical protein